MPRKLTIVIPSMGKSCLQDCLKSIFENTKPEEEFDVIIVKNYQKGYSIPVNNGIRLADKNSDILLLNDDIIIEEPFIEKLYEPLKDGIKNIGLVSHDMIKYGFKDRQLGRSNFAFVLIPRETINKVGLLDEEYILSAQDMDYCYRVSEVNKLMQKKVDIKVKHWPSSQTVKDMDTPEIHNKDNLLFEKKWFSEDGNDRN